MSFKEKFFKTKESVVNLKPREKINNFFDKIVDIYIYSAITSLVIYMVTTFVFKMRGMYNEYALGLENPKYTNVDPSQISTLMQQELLHNIAFIIVLIKAYTIMREYAKYRHISIKYILEIAIIAPVVEVVFNYHSYDFNMIVFYGVFASIISGIYLYFYQDLKKAENDYRESHK